MFRIGIGNDTHRLIDGRPLMLGGVHVASDRGGEGHSDADALLHAIIDALLGARAEGDIGKHFPDNDPQWKGADSIEFLRKVALEARDDGWAVVNIDSTIMLESPKIAPHVYAMREQISGALGVPISAVSVKAKTGEGVDAVGQKLAVSAQAVVLLRNVALERKLVKLLDEVPD